MDVEEVKTVTVNTLIKVQLLQALLMLKVCMDVEELKTELRCRGLPTVGNKKALCQRLEDYAC